MHYIETPDGIKWHYAIEGEGEPLLFIHGWGVNMRIWRQQYKYFSEHYTVIIIDLPGHGKTSWQRVSLEEIAKDIFFVLDAIGVSAVNIVGSSLGGLVAFKMYQTARERISRMTLVGSHAKFSKSNDYPYGLDTAAIRKLGEQLDGAYPAIVHIFFRSLFTKEERKSRRYIWLQKFRRADIVPGQEALVELLDVLEREDMRPVLDRIAVPIQFINGTHDTICPMATIDYYKQKIGHARIDLFDRCGHFPFLSKPHQFNSVLEDFLKQKVS